MAGGGGGEGEMILELHATEDPSFNLAKAVCSHGLFMMAPNRWDPATKTLHRPLRIPSSSASVSVTISQPSPSKPRLLISTCCSSPLILSPQDQRSLLGQVRRMLRISAENDRVIREFHNVHADAKERGFGRVFRSPTLFEDMVKCILLCNCQWSRTLSMARALCELQLELRSSSTVDDFQPKTPQPREKKRKRGKGKKKSVLKLETKFSDNESKLSSDANSMIDGDSQTEHPQRNELCASVLSNTECSSNICGSPRPADVVGDFPTPDELASLDSEFLARQCRLGYRAPRIISLAKSVVNGTLPLKDLELVLDGSVSSSYEEKDKQLSAVNGFGPFTRANVLMCMGFYNRIPMDSETMRHLKMVHAKKCTIQSVQKDVEAIYGKYGQFQFLAYWHKLP